MTARTPTPATAIDDIAGVCVGALKRRPVISSLVLLGLFALSVAPGHLAPVVQIALVFTAVPMLTAWGLRRAGTVTRWAALCGVLIVFLPVWTRSLSTWLAPGGVTAVLLASSSLLAIGTTAGLTLIHDARHRGVRGLLLALLAAIVMLPWLGPVGAPPSWLLGAIGAPRGVSSPPLTDLTVLFALLLLVTAGGGRRVATMGGGALIVGVAIVAGTSPLYRHADRWLAIAAASCCVALGGRACALVIARADLTQSGTRLLLRPLVRPVRWTVIVSAVAYPLLLAIHSFAGSAHMRELESPAQASLRWPPGMEYIEGVWWGEWLWSSLGSPVDLAVWQLTILAPALTFVVARAFAPRGSALTTAASAFAAACAMWLAIGTVHAILQGFSFGMLSLGLISLCAIGWTGVTLPGVERGGLWVDRTLAVLLGAAVAGEVAQGIVGPLAVFLAAGLGVLLARRCAADLTGDRTRRALPWIVALAILGAFARAWMDLAVGLRSALEDGPFEREFVRDRLIATALLLLAGGAFVAFVRRLRSMTLIPRDHAIYADFGGSPEDALRQGAMRTW